MASALTSWKEIAQHLGKGVRTVQRWEREGLPVRRPKDGHKGRVVAYPEELDRWLRSAYSQDGEDGDSNVVALTETIYELLTENESLRRSLNALMKVQYVPDGINPATGTLLERCSKALEQSALIRQRCAELTRHHATARQPALKPSMP
jgi:hypothetical protein